MTSDHSRIHGLEVFRGTAGTSGKAPGGGLLEVVEPPPSLRRGLLRTARPRQWVKNLLVFGAPGTAGLLSDPAVVILAIGAFAVFCLAASGTYFLNDALGVDADRRHPTKSRRPVATGVVTVGLAKVLGPLLLAISVVLALVIAGWRLAVVVSCYAALQPAYSLWLRNVPVVDLAAVASGFVLRAIAGGVAVGVPISRWFLIVTSFGSLFLVSGKRTAEHIELGEDRCSHRSTLGDYSLAFLHHVRVLSSSVAVGAYCLWAFERAEVATYSFWFPVSIVPFVLLVLRYALLLNAGKGGSPEELVLDDRLLQGLGVVWLTTVGVGIHAG